MRVAVLGTGIMGGPMARNLARAGHDVTVWNRTVQKAEALEEDGARVASTPVDAVRDAEFVLTMLADARAVEETIIESGTLDVMPQGGLWIQSSTIGVAATERLAASAGERGITFVDAPVLGTKKPAEDGQLFMLASGPEEARVRCKPVFDAISRGHVWLGEAGLGTRLKLVANNWILCTMENLAETFVLAQTLGVDPHSFLDAISGGGMDMPYAHLKGEAMLNQDFPASFPLVHARKDVALILDAAGDIELPLVRATLQQFDRAFELGHGDEDMSAVYYASALVSALPIDIPGKIVCVGLNYRDHAEEQGIELPKAPLLFAKWSNALIGPGEPIVIPRASKQVDYEAELGVVIGERVRGVSEENALEAVRGYICLNDVSARDLQFSDGQWTRGKSADTFCPVGPQLVPAADVPDPQALGIRCVLNGVTMQDSTTANMIFTVAEIIAYASATMTLEAGDLIATGTPAGVGVFRDPPVLLKAGDEVTIEIDGLGSLTNPVQAEA